MPKIRAKLLQYEHIDVDAIFEKETQLLQTIQAGKLDQALLLWQTDKNTLVLPSGNKWQQSEQLTNALAKVGWQVTTRKTGGAPVPQSRGVINVSYLYALPSDETYSIPDAYERFCDILSSFFAHYDIDVDTHATPGSYCDGDYNLNIQGQKVVGTAQRVVLKQGGGKVILAQACILIDVKPHDIVKPVNLCYQQHHQPERIDARVHTCLLNHTDKKPSTTLLFQCLYDSFTIHNKS